MSEPTCTREDCRASACTIKRLKQEIQQREAGLAKQLENYTEVCGDFVRVETRLHEAEALLREVTEVRPFPLPLHRKVAEFVGLDTTVVPHVRKT